MADKGKDLAALYLSERKRLERQIDRKVGCHSTASDLVQDIFLRLWEKAIEWKGDSAAYLSRCARNAAIDHLRAEKTREEYLKSELPDPFTRLPCHHRRSSQLSRISGHIERGTGLFCRKKHAIYLLNRVYGRSFSEIAGVMGISPQCGRKHMARAVSLM